MKIFDIRWKCKTCGPSPNNSERIELFLFGCKKAVKGHPCKECFNSITWHNSICKKTYSPFKVCSTICKYADSKYITIGGGEPTDNFEELIELTGLLKKCGFNIMVYTWKSLKDIFELKNKYPDVISNIETERENFRKLMKNVNIIVDGEYYPDLRIYNKNANDGFLNSIGSSNQIIWSKENNNFIGYKMEDINNIEMNKNNKLIYYLKDNNKKEVINFG